MLESKQKQLEQVLRDPGRIYRRTPLNVTRDRRFNDSEHLQILSAWETILKTGDVNERDLLHEVGFVREETQKKIERSKRREQ